MGESRFDQQSQFVGQQFNADRQEFAGKWVSNQYIADGGQVTVNYQTDHVDSARQRTAVDLYVTLGQVVDLSLRFRGSAEAGNGAKTEVGELQQMVHEACTLTGELRAEMRRFRAVSKSDVSVDLAEKIVLLILTSCASEANAAGTRVTGKAMAPHAVRHLKERPTPEALSSHLRRLHREFLQRVVRS
ncbi:MULTISPECIES: hypothetical protein [Streptomyces]|uniref:Uncharacterized protein n=1 Tax=Streptomyces edwardsiae TaxID=3075527 RepID=A0ABU2PYR9_9ACTN|nr:hypothetical protein [Streptomyces sp. DSM 41636]MDT0397316.1 hypothetical protein [Streptomyces sp. DSM 41636]